MTTSYDTDTLIRVSKMNGRKASADSTMIFTDQPSPLLGSITNEGVRLDNASEAHGVPEMLPLVP
jgi:hypothetical protein